MYIFKFCWFLGIILRIFHYKSLPVTVLSLKLIHLKRTAGHQKRIPDTCWCQRSNHPLKEKKQLAVLERLKNVNVMATSALTQKDSLKHGTRSSTVSSTTRFFFFVFWYHVNQRSERPFSPPVPTPSGYCGGAERHCGTGCRIYFLCLENVEKRGGKNRCPLDLSFWVGFL